MDLRLLGSVTVEVDEPLDAECLVKASELAQAKSGANVSVSSDGRLVDWSFRFAETGDPLKLAAFALDSVQVALQAVGVDDWTLARVAAVSEEEQRRDARRISPVVGMAEAVDLLGRSRQRINQYIEQGRFPRPLAKLRSGPVWTRDEILDFAQTIRGPGRPRQEPD